MTDTIEELKDFIITILEEKKAQNINLVNLVGKTDFARYMIFANGTSIKNISYIAEFIKQELKHKYNFIPTIEGANTSGWVLVDCGDIVIHIFHPETRNLLKVEEMWSKK